ncbi:phosphonate metabolism transcriptional regulator PhnF [Marinovum sp. 2_MG-2023]|uniref:phosphonate metabolism transcriptional regulator PhnF n=1 Tax=Roseobacteraceae TaxID=2854170 RepID=UPI001FD5C26A|nr:MULTISPECIES: phosphonate metabolism transcriptional regulator PhnF [Roseobacteraceae]MCJ7872718.1 phosphonate metabolism transcriptional regulator PhnF [Phaeobacter sp. J2-8]MDO6729932.1 phosphonate metabolism transcriptional regulator PhnF [Marinovum sp. 2_MG-2023]MDO6779746.1 phosphonate metabolism transcriptional regulator PhnF [Marinovum sp. 1_MG-2023]
MPDPSSVSSSGTAPTRTPIWKAIHTDIADAVARGQYSVGDKLPTESDLAARFGVNRHTVRRALKELAADGLVHARRGAGVFVTGRPTDYKIGRRTRFTRNIEAQGKVPARSIDVLETRTADPTEAEALHLPKGAQVLVCEGVSLANEEPIAVFRSVFPADRLPGFPEHLEQMKSITRALQAIGIADYTREDTRITARVADATQALKLRIDEGDPLILSIAINHAAEGWPLEYGLAWFVGERVTLQIET